MLSIDYGIKESISYIHNTSTSLLCLEDIAFYNECGADDKVLFSEHIKSAQATVEGYLGYPLMIGNRQEVLRKRGCFCDCNGYYVWANMLPVVYSELGTDGNRVYIENCCVCDFEYISGYVPCGWDLDTLNAYLGTDFTELPSRLNERIANVIWEIASSTYNQGKLGLDGLERTTTTDLNGNIKSWKKDMNAIPMLLLKIKDLKV